MSTHRVYSMSIGRIYPLYLTKVQKKDRTKTELDRVITWLTGYSQKQLEAQLKAEASLEDFFAQAPKMNPNRKLITGVICGIRVEEIEEPLMQEIRYMDKLVDELARGKALDKILRA